MVGVVVGLDGPDAASWTATSSPAILTTTWPPGIATTLTRRPMQRLGTDHSLPAALTSMVGGTVWTLTSPTIDSRSRRFPMGRRLSFSRMNSASGGRPVVRFGPEFAWASTRATASTRPLHPVNSPP